MWGMGISSQDRACGGGGSGSTVQGFEDTGWALLLAEQLEHVRHFANVIVRNPSHAPLEQVTVPT